MSIDDTIAAIASPPGGGARGIVRITGPQAIRILREVLRVKETLRGEEVSIDRLRSEPDSVINKSDRFETCPAELRRATRIEAQFELLTSPRRVSVDVAAYVWPNARSYTGQPSAELHLPGSPPLLEAVLDRIYAVGARPARRGEFTLRAFLAGRLDLAQAEAVLGVIDACDSAELSAALRQLAGGLSGQIDGLRSALLDLLADLEAGLDFVDEDIQFVERPALIERLQSAYQQVSHLFAQADVRMTSTDRLRVVLAGLPNAGKSTLFNRLVGCENSCEKRGQSPLERGTVPFSHNSFFQPALVSEIEGTTRDYLSCPVVWDGIEFDLVDTAGWEPIERDASYVVGGGSRRIVENLRSEISNLGSEIDNSTSAHSEDIQSSESHLRGRCASAFEESNVIGKRRDAETAENTDDGLSGGTIAFHSQQHAANQLGQADLIVWCSPCDWRSPESDVKSVISDFTSDKEALDRQRLESVIARGRPVLVVRTKADLWEGRELGAKGLRPEAEAHETMELGLSEHVERCVSEDARSRGGPGLRCSQPTLLTTKVVAGYANSRSRVAPQLGLESRSDSPTEDGLVRTDEHVSVPTAFVSVQIGSGIEELKAAILSELGQLRRGACELVGSTAARARDSLRHAMDSLQRACSEADTGAGDELIAIDVRDGLDHLGTIVGAVYTDDLLDRIFSRFCIGK